MDFDFVYFGQTCLKYKTPVEVFAGLTDIYEKRKKELPKANKQLVGKIQDEVSLHYAGPNNDKMHQHNFLPTELIQWFYSTFKHYLDWNRIEKYNMNINSIWVNEMKAGEYNPVHGFVALGWVTVNLIRVVGVKLLSDTGEEGEDL